MNGPIPDLKPTLGRAWDRQMRKVDKIAARLREPYDPQLLKRYHYAHDKLMDLAGLCCAIESTVLWHREGCPRVEPEEIAWIDDYPPLSSIKEPDQ